MTISRFDQSRFFVAEPVPTLNGAAVRMTKADSSRSLSRADAATRSLESRSLASLGMTKRGEGSE